MKVLRNRNYLFGDPETRQAEFSPCKQYRYLLRVAWGQGQMVNFLMLNPSTADEHNNDPTVHRCIQRAKMWKFAGVIVTNLFAFRATDKNAMLAAAVPIGRDNDLFIQAAAKSASTIICAWGKDGGHLNRDTSVMMLLRKYDLYVLRKCKDGSPEHPLYLPYDLTPVLWRKHK